MSTFCMRNNTRRLCKSFILPKITIQKQHKGKKGIFSTITISVPAVLQGNKIKHPLFLYFPYGNKAEGACGLFFVFG